MVSLPPLDRESVIPLYHQIQQRLLGQIQAGVFKLGEPLPSAQEIASALGVSPMTVRQAIKSLCELGVIYSEQGKGTFVSGIKIDKNFRQVLSFTEDMKARGWVPATRVLKFEVRKPAPDVADALRLGPEEEIFHLARLRLADALPLGIEYCSLPRRLCPDLMERFDPSTSLYEALSRSYGIHIAVADEVVEVGFAKKQEAQLLKTAKNHPAFLFTPIAYVQSGQPIEHVRSVYRGDRYRVVNRLTRVNRELLEASLAR
jgi:GntR family transcriptional regulator